MRIHEIRPKKKNLKPKRVGRGSSSGWGKTCGRGSEGAKQRSGSPHYSGFEGGQMPLYRRLPKRGFRNPMAQKFEVVNIEKLCKFSPNSEVTPQKLIARGWIRGKVPLKILGKGEINIPLTVKAHAFSHSAREKIEKAGGKAVTL